MRLTNYFLPLLKENPAEAQIASHRLMLRAGMISQLSAGIYNWLPLGLAVLRNIENIIREELDKAGCVELLMPTIQPTELWEESGRGSYGAETLKIVDRHGRNMIYGPTNEEVVTDIFRKHVKSYKDLPLNLYHIQWKFRDEIRPRFGVMRGREFLMKDAYTFDIDEEKATEAYNRMYVTYLKIFRRLGLYAIPFRAETGAIGGNLSHEFQILAQTGESEIWYDQAFEQHIERDEPDIEAMQNLYSAADEMHDAENCPVPADQLKHARGIEVGHIFYFGDKYTAPMKVKFPGPDGKEITPKCGSHGIGVSRLVGAIIEASHDDKGIIWPESVAPFKVGLVNLKQKDEACAKACDDAYNKLRNAGLTVLYDDTDTGAGQKFAKMELIGLPWQLAIGPRGLEQGTVELKHRKSGESRDVSLDATLNELVS